MSMQVGATCTYTPTPGEQPMAQGKPQAAIVTDWDEIALKADLIVFAKNASYGYYQDGVLEGTDPGTFQQLVAGATSGSAPAAPAAASHSTPPTAHSSHKG